MQQRIDSARWEELLPSSASKAVASITPAALGGATAYAAYELQAPIALTVLLPITVATLYLAIWLMVALRDLNRRLADQEIVAHVMDVLRVESKSAVSAPLVTSSPTLGEFQLYIRYRSLGAADFARIVDLIDSIYAEVVLTLHGVNVQEMASTMAPASERLLPFPEDRLELAYVATGESIKVRFRNGWWFGLAVDKGEPVIEVPRRLAGVTLTGYLLLSAVNYGTHTAKDAAELMKTYRETQKIELEMNELQQKLDHQPEHRERLEERLRELQKVTTHNAEFTGVRVDVGGR